MGLLAAALAERVLKAGSSSVVRMFPQLSPCSPAVLRLCTYPCDAGLGFTGICKRSMTGPVLCSPYMGSQKDESLVAKAVGLFVLDMAIWPLNACAGVERTRILSG